MSKQNDPNGLLLHYVEMYESMIRLVVLIQNPKLPPLLHELGAAVEKLDRSRIQELLYQLQTLADPAIPQSMFALSAGRPASETPTSTGANGTPASSTPAAPDVPGGHLRNLGLIADVDGAILDPSATNGFDDV